MKITLELRRIKSLVEQGLLFEAETILQTVIQQEPSNITALLLLSEVMEKQLRRLDAIECVKHVLALNPDNAEAMGKLNTLTSPREIDWINSYFTSAGALNRDEIDSVLYFSLIWNMFEGIICHKNASIPTMERAVNSLQLRGRLQSSDFELCLSYFKKRYITDGRVNARFTHLRFRPSDREALVADVLTGNVTDPVSTLLAMLIIVYRYRNNLFHGEKSVKELRGQRENFRIANQLLMKFLERWRSG